jgi:hypothetical protein
MRQNKAARTNKNFLTATMLLAIVVLGSVSILWYVAFSNEKEKKDLIEKEKYEIHINSTLIGDSIGIMLNGSTLFFGTITSSDTQVKRNNGNPTGNMISVADAKTGNTINEDLPDNPSVIDISKDSNGLLIITTQEKQ